MSNGIRICIATAVFALLLLAPATSQEPTPDALAYTPTGDALWDTYALALLEQLPNIPFAINNTDAGMLPSELLDGWEEEFGADPRYWELRYWNAIQEAGFDSEKKYLAINYLLRSREIGVSDAMTEMAIYKFRNDAAWDSWTWVYVISSDDKPTFGELDIPFAPVGFPWTEEQELQVAGNLVAACPNESWVWYASAMNRFDYGDWEAGLDDMRRGNEAVNNRRPIPFPISFVLQRTADGQDCGSEVAAGIVAEEFRSWPSPDFALIKDHAKNQNLRISLGAPLSELGPWHGYNCRFGSMEGAGMMHSTVSYINQSQTLRKLFVETPESFTMDQRDALWSLHLRSQFIRRYIDEYRHSTDNGLQMALGEVFDEHNIANKPDMTDFYYLWKFDSYPELGSEFQMARYRWLFKDFKAEYVIVYEKSRKQFDKLATFNFETFSWPER